MVRIGSRLLPLALVALACSGKSDPPPPPPPAPVPAPAGEPIPAAPAPRPAPEDEAMEREYAEMTRDAIPAEDLTRFVPLMLAGVGRSHLSEQVFAVGAAYQLEGGGYLNLDVKNTFRRGTGSDLEDVLAASCPRMEKIGGHDGCLRTSADRASLHWYLPDRLTVDLAAPDEELLRKAAGELPLDEIAALSSAR